MEISGLKSQASELERFRNEMEPQLNTARREIELNKSILDMLNNEIGHLSSEKCQLEKKLLNARRNTTPSVIVEEDEEDLIEEERQSSGELIMTAKLSRNEDRDERDIGVIDVASDSHDAHVGHTTDGSLLFLNNKVN